MYIMQQQLDISLLSNLQIHNYYYADYIVASQWPPQISAGAQPAGRLRTPSMEYEEPQRGYQRMGRV